MQEKKEIEQDEVGKIIKEKLSNHIIDGYYLFGNDRTCLPKSFDADASGVENFEIRNDDVIVSGYPKSGTTWTQEMVWLLRNNLDYDKAKVVLADRFPRLDCPELVNLRYLRDSSVRSRHIDYLNSCPSPRLLKTHLPFSLLPMQIRDGSKVPKVVYVMRNPKDVFVSFYCMGPILLEWNVSQEEFAKVFLADKVLYAPYWKNVLGYWRQKHMPNLLILRYEDMIDDLKSVIQKTCAFLEREPLTTEQLDKLCKHLYIDSMKENKAVNYEKVIAEKKKYNPNVAFIRKGKVGAYKTEMTPELIANFDEWIKKNIAGTDFNENYAYFGQI